jgi:hypothetical protein
MAWRAAASFVSFAILLLSITRAITSFARNPLRIVGAATLAGILTIAGIGAFAIVLSAAETVVSFTQSFEGTDDRQALYEFPTNPVNSADA